jgi:hypothetical protein
MYHTAEIIFNGNWNKLMKQNINLCYEKVLTDTLKQNDIHPGKA